MEKWRWVEEFNFNDSNFFGFYSNGFWSLIWGNEEMEVGGEYEVGFER